MDADRTLFARDEGGIYSVQTERTGSNGCRAVVIDNLSVKELDLPGPASFFLDREGKSFWAALDPAAGTS